MKGLWITAVRPSSKEEGHGEGGHEGASYDFLTRSRRKSIKYFLRPCSGFVRGLIDRPEMLKGNEARESGFSSKLKLAFNDIIHLLLNKSCLLSGRHKIRHLEIKKRCLEKQTCMEGGREKRNRELEREMRQ